MLNYITMSKKVYIGCGAGFAGDRYDASIPIVEDFKSINEPKYLMFEVLAERTLAIAQQYRINDASKGYSPYLDYYINPILQDCLEHKIKIISNMGAANPFGAAKRIIEIAKEKKIRKPKIAIVQGDDILNYMSEKDILNSPTMEGLDIKNTKITAANVYLGAFPIANALKKDVDIVIVGRSVDSALALGPLIYEFNWNASDLKMLSSGTICGHLLECGAQVTGAYFADPGFKDVPDLYNVGFPIAEFHENGDFLISKPKNTGGLVNKATITEQLLYETHNPNQYIVPDVVADMSELNLIEEEPNKVLVKGAVGHKKPDLLKATICSESGFMGEAEMSYAGPNALQRAKLAIEVIEKRIQKIGLQGKTRFDIIGAGSVHFSSSEENTYNNELDGDYRIRSAGFFENKEDAEQFVAETYSLYCSGPSAGGGARTSITKETSTASILIDRNIVEPQIKIEII